MRKRYKKKLRSCKLCKPHKMGIDKRWKPKEEAKEKQHLGEIREASDR
jgi:hypothetical protein